MTDAAKYREKIEKLSERDHVLQRSGTYISGRDETTIGNMFLKDDHFEYDEVQYVPGLIKIIYEVIDNCVDVAIKSKFVYGNKVNIRIENNIVSVSDNGYGISQDIDPETGESSVVLAVCHARSGSNFTDDESVQRFHLGMNGVGVFTTNVFSKNFVCDTRDGENRAIVRSVNNFESYTFERKKYNGKPGTTITFEPDLERFKVKNLDETYINIIKQRLYIIAVTYPEMEFKLNDEVIKFRNYKQFLKMFGENYEVATFDNGFVAFFPSMTDEFNHYTIINSQVLIDGGNHVDHINSKVINYLRDKYSKKYKDIKPGDIRNKLMLVALFRKFPNANYSGQTKDRLANSASEISKYLGDIDFDTLGLKIYRNSEMSDNITDMYKIREEFNNRKKADRIGSKQTRVKSDKYWPALGDKKNLLLCEGLSAVGGISRELGRQNNGYVALRGKPLNVLEAKMTRVSDNEEIDLIFKILGTGVTTSDIPYSGDYFILSSDYFAETYTVHINDIFLEDDNEWTKVKDLFFNDKYQFEKIERKKVDKDSYFSQRRVNQEISVHYDDIIVTTDQDLDGCFLGNTLIKSLDGKSYTFEELVKNNVKELWVYSKNKEGHMVPSLAVNPRITKYVDEYIELEFESGVLCSTLDHLFLLTNGEYKKAKDLTSDDSISSLYFRYVSGNFTETSNTFYEQFKNNKRGWISTHRYVKSLFEKIEKGNHVHHKDFNSLNNIPDNLERTETLKDHLSFHTESSSKNINIFNKNPERIKKLKERFKNDIEFVKNFREGLILYNKSKKNRESTTKMNKDPEIHKKQVMGHVLRFVSYLINNNIEVNEENYSLYKKGFSVVSFKKALEYFSSIDKMIEISRNYPPLTENNIRNYDSNRAKKFKEQIKNIALKMISENIDLNEENYMEFRKKNKSRVPRWENILKYFSSYEELLEYITKNNHNIISSRVIKLDTPVPVYDLTVKKYHNFLVEIGDDHTEGVIVHNSHIRALIITLFNTFIPQIIKFGRLKYLQTPLFTLNVKGECINYFFTIEEQREFIKNNPNIKGEWRYYKGLGSWAKGELKKIIDKEGIDKFIKTYIYDDETDEILRNWMSKFTSEYRKTLIQADYITVENA